MKTTGLRSVVLYILLAAFIVGIGWFIVSIFLNGGKWAMQPYNGHLSPVAMGKITDRNGQVLAASEDNERIYHENALVRAALLHTVGDTDGYISTSVQASKRSQLAGYNMITGINDVFINKINSNIKLTVDANVSLDAYQALGDRNGAVTVYNYKTGEIITKVSKPSYDPVNVPQDIEGNVSYNGVYLDHNLSVAYTPGSIFKLVTQAAAMEKWSDTWSERTYTCEGQVSIGGSSVSCLGTHGTVNAAEALGNSCNVYYALLANDIGAEDLQKKAEQFGFNKKTKFDAIECVESKINLNQAKNLDLAWAGVGQYTLLANPYHMLTLMGAIANDGEYVQPKLTNSLDILGKLKPDDRKYMSNLEASQTKNLMRGNVRDYYGDYLFPEGMQVCAKTGTAEVGGGKAPTCWMVGFSDSIDTPYAFVVVVEEGSGGIETAGAVASTVMQSVVNWVK